MTTPVNAMTGCLLVGEYVDEAECPTTTPMFHGEPMRPKVVGDYLDLGERDEEMKKFTALLKDGRVVVIRGHALKHAPHPLAGEDVFGVVVRNKTEEVLVAVFKSTEVSGIFHGDLRSDRKIA